MESTTLLFSPTLQSSLFPEIHIDKKEGRLRLCNICRKSSDIVSVLNEIFYYFKICICCKMISLTYLRLGAKPSQKRTWGLIYLPHLGGGSCLLFLSKIIFRNYHRHVTLHRALKKMGFTFKVLMLPLKTSPHFNRGYNFPPGRLI